MSVIRIERVHRTGFTTLSHHAVRNPKLGRAARGLLWELCSHSPTYAVTVERLVEASTDGRDRLLTGKAQLEENGYLRVHHTYNPQTGKMNGSKWIVTDDPEVAPLPPRTEKRIMVPDSGNPNDGDGENHHAGNQHALEVSRRERSFEKEESPRSPPEGGVREPLELEIEGVEAVDPTVWMHGAWRSTFENGREIKLTKTRAQKYRAMFDEQLKASPSPELAWTAILHALKNSRHHNSDRTFVMPESFLRSEERRDQWVEKAVGIIESARRKSEGASSFAEYYRKRRAAG